jgi:hypothetical protein
MQSLSKTKKLRTCSKIIRPQLAIEKMKILFFWHHDFFASFWGQVKNEDPSRLEMKNKPNINTHSNLYKEYKQLY